jgi:hypothetical protein
VAARCLLYVCALLSCAHAFLAPYASTKTFKVHSSSRGSATSALRMSTEQEEPPKERESTKRTLQALRRRGSDALSGVFGLRQDLEEHSAYTPLKQYVSTSYLSTVTCLYDAAI